MPLNSAIGGVDGATAPSTQTPLHLLGEDEKAAIA